MTFRSAWLVSALLLATGFAHSTTGYNQDLNVPREWNFRVYLGDAEIGHHRFRLTQEGGTTVLSTEADFKVRFLFFTAYRYQHVNSETWRDDCLQRIDAHTDANGKIIDVEGEQRRDAFHLEAPDSSRALSGCIKTFAYWNPGILHEDALLNPQTGEMMPVEVEEVSTETLVIRGRDVAARRFRLTTEDLSLDIWYSNDSEWLALESTTKDGRTLRYELI